jgi:hypothetical protein
MGVQSLACFRSRSCLHDPTQANVTLWETAENVLLTLVQYVSQGAKPIATAFLKDLLKGLPLKFGHRNKQSPLLGFLQEWGYKH